MSDDENDPVVDDAPGPDPSARAFRATGRFDEVTRASSEAAEWSLPSNELPYTPTAYALLAAEILQDLDAVAAKIAKLEWPHPSTAKFMRSHVNVPRRFLDTAVGIVHHSPEVQAIGTLDAEEGLDTLQFHDAFRPVADRLAALTKGLRYTMAARKARLAAKALQLYAILKGLARSRSGADFASMVRILARDLGPRGRPKATKPAEW